ncbi:TetR/AcrR family transcriptional regulator [Deinococcus cellulosilyticus]|uniref:HTH tetR-type domain-containing protein n=1 Tax=Deinococcus cellulosilyticus (strain DSM 18568 / NBRC 106333 / KACC 11606 / 5516J-15) TaxID=1223518 RepID=A0A511MZC0_DEIC1|nr:TetR/AcrR family transcriptional regulator [Deinococcus cellulosilyticus]GEM45970.1 hypothetical protein DC3_16050 [Deinococcus cellulosilyticus NBRC 106333 = KACC 11606]
MPRHTDTKHILLDIARELFAEQGYRVTTLEQIAARAGITKPAVYRHYSSKQAILEALLKQADQQEQEIFTEDTSLPLRDRLIQVAHLYTGGFNPLMAVITGASDKREQVAEAEMHARKHMRQTLARLTGLFEREIQQGSVQGDPQILAVMFSSVIHGSQMHLSRNPILQEKQILEASIDVFLNGCLRDKGQLQA